MILRKQDELSNTRRDFMFKSILLALGLMLTINAQAYSGVDFVKEINKGIFENTAGTRGMFDFKVGDTANYNVNMIFPGTMVMTVTDVQPEVVTISQKMQTLFGAQDCVQKLNPNTGESLGLTCNGQQQDEGDPNDLEVLEQKEDTVTVPAGTFTCLYMKVQKKSTQDIIEQWINPSEVPVFGMVKQIQPSQLGPVTIELTSFRKMQ
jgi:hypothetical protein